MRCIGLPFVTRGINFAFGNYDLQKELNDRRECDREQPLRDRETLCAYY